MADHEVTKALSPGNALNEAENAGSYEVEVEKDSAKKTSSKRFKRNRKIAFAVAVVIAVLGIIFVIIGVVLITQSKSEGKKSLESEKDASKDVLDECAFSAEAKRAGLPEFFKKVDRSFYELHPYDAGKMTGVPLEYIKKLFQPYNPTPESIKAIAERSQSLWAELNGMKIDRTLLLAREQRMIAQTDHFLKHYFGRPYENNYLSGYWMLGPGRYCTRTFKGITSIKKYLAMMLLLFRPKTAAELEDSLTLLEKFKDGINQFKENLKNGIRTGMVGSVTVCKEGKGCLEDRYLEIASQRSGRGVLSWIPDRVSLFISGLLPEESDKITERYGKNGSALVEESLIRNVGSPIANLLEYLDKEHLPHCVPSNVSSGLGTLPVDYVYFNGSRTMKRTNRTLANGDRIMSGKESYSSFMSLHTTQRITPDEVNIMGWKMLNKLYSQAVKIAKQITKKENDDEAVREFRNHLNSSAMYFNENPFPENESNEEAYRKCKNVKDAQVYCPERYKTMLKWLDLARNTIARIRPKLTSLFYFAGNKTTAPNCPVSMVINFNPLRSVQSYSGGSSTCAGPGRYNVPFFVDRMGPKFFEFTVNAHEASPGHHTQVQGYMEHFRDVCRVGVDYDFLKISHVTASREGWALYAENPLAAQDTDLYQDRPLESYGAIKSQIWRALRLIIDTGLHYKNLTRDQALDLFNRYMWDDSDVVTNEVSRYQAWPGQATSYMTGQLAIWGMRNETLTKLGNKFKLQDFHYHILSLGVAPISFLRSNIERYTNCVLHEEDEGCKDVLTAYKKQESYSEAAFKEDNDEYTNLKELNEIFQENDDDEAIY